MSVALALAAAALFGTGDFLGGVATRRSNVLTVVLVSHLIGLAGIAVLASITRGTITGSDFAFGAAGGLAGAAGVAMLYLGLAAGQMSLVAPITGVVAVVVPVFAGVGFGERPSALQYGGMALAVAAVLLLGAGGRGRRLGRLSLAYAIGSGLCFGLFYVFLARTSPVANLWPVVAARCASVSAALLISLALQRVPRLSPSTVKPVVGTGVFDVAANALYLLAVHAGLLSIVAVLVSLYPVSTVLCSLAFLGERLRRGQLLGVTAALVAVVLITA